MLGSGDSEYCLGAREMQLAGLSRKAADAEVERPADGARAGLLAPAGAQLGDDIVKRVMPLILDIPAGGRPGIEKTNQVVQLPFGFHEELGRLDLFEGERQGQIALIQIMEAVRPVAGEDILVVSFQNTIDTRINDGKMVGPHCQDGPRPANAPRFGVEGLKVEPVNGGANRYEIQAAGGDRGAFSRFHAVGNPVVSESVLDLPVIDWVGAEPMPGETFTYVLELNPEAGRWEMLQVVEVKTDG